MNEGALIWEDIIRCLIDSTHEDKIIALIELYAKTSIHSIRGIALLSCAAENKKFKCARAIVDCGLLRNDITRELKFVFCYWKNYKNVFSVLFRLGIKLPERAIVLNWFSGFSKTRRRKMMKKLEFVAKLKSGANNARRAALTMLAIVRFKRNQHMARCINMDAIRIIARMIYESGIVDWKVWKTGKRKSERLQKKRRVAKL